MKVTVSVTFFVGDATTIEAMEADSNACGSVLGDNPVRLADTLTRDIVSLT
jgi:hypothetical protein